MTAPIRVLHVVGAMNRGGVETWLMRVLRAIDRERYRFDFVVHTEQPAVFDEEIRGLGGRVFPCPNPGRPLTYARGFSRILRDHGPFDVVHSHVHHFSGHVLSIANRSGIRHRIAHSHSDTRLVDQEAGWGRQAYLRLMKFLIRRNATAWVGASSQAAAALFGNAYRTSFRYRQIFCGIDCNAAAGQIDRVKVLATLGLPLNAYVVGHVARFDPPKNHNFLLEIARATRSCDPRTHFLLVGDGPLREATQQRARALHIEDRVHFLGLRADVMQLLQAMDVFILPSLYEGLPVAALEAQVSGLPLLLSDSITRDLDVIPDLVIRLPLSDGAGKWASRLIQVRDSTPRIPRELAFDRFRKSPFDMQAGIAELEQLYAAP